MNKIKATKLEMRNNYRILGIGYCNMQHLLNYQRAISYSAGNNGWSCDYYYINNVVISTGYSYLDSKNMKDDYNLVREYEQKASELNNEEGINKLLFELIEKLKVVKA